MVSYLARRLGDAAFVALVLIIATEAPTVLAVAKHKWGSR